MSRQGNAGKTKKLPFSGQSLPLTTLGEAGTSPSVCPVCGNPLVKENAAAEGSFQFCPNCRGKAKLKDPSEIRPGDIVGSYRILKKIAQGGMGALFLCCPRNDFVRRYVLKMLCMSQDDDPELSAKRFRREALLLSRLNHESIVKVYEAWDDGLNMCLIMEYVDGYTLEQLRLKNCYDFNEAVSIQIMTLLAQALNYAWEKLKLLHRDIKPSNIMIDDKGHIRLLDFGIAKSMDSTSTTVLTLPDHGLGTPGFMSPEQFHNTSALSCTTDIYSLGATIYFLLTGKPPFTGKNPAAVLKEMLSHEAVPVHKLNPAVSENFSRLLQKTLSRDPAQRPFSWRKLLANLDRVSSGRPPLLE